MNGEFEKTNPVGTDDKEVSATQAVADGEEVIAQAELEVEAQNTHAPTNPHYSTGTWQGGWYSVANAATRVAPVAPAAPVKTEATSILPEATPVVPEATNVVPEVAPVEPTRKKAGKLWKVIQIVSFILSIATLGMVVTFISFPAYRLYLVFAILAALALAGNVVSLIKLGKNGKSVTGLVLASVALFISLCVIIFNVIPSFGDYDDLPGIYEEPDIPGGEHGLTSPIR